MTAATRAGQEGWQLSTLVRRQARRGHRRGARLQGLHATLAGALEPLTDGTLGDAERRGNLALLPALLVELPRPEAPAFAPILGMRCRLHVWTGSMIVATVLGLYAVVSNDNRRSTAIDHVIPQYGASVMYNGQQGSERLL